MRSDPPRPGRVALADAGRLHRRPSRTTSADQDQRLRLQRRPTATASAASASCRPASTAPGCSTTRSITAWPAIRLRRLYGPVCSGATVASRRRCRSGGTRLASRCNMPNGIGVSLQWRHVGKVKAESRRATRRSAWRFPARSGPAYQGAALLRPRRRPTRSATWSTSALASTTSSTRIRRWSRPALIRGLVPGRSVQRQHLPGHLGCAGPVPVGRCDDRLPAAAPSLRRRLPPAAAASGSSGDADVPGRVGDPGDRDVPGSAASAAAAAAGSGARSKHSAS